MKALAIDSASSRLVISAKNDDKMATTIFEIGMKQSETLLPAIQYVLNSVDLNPEDLDYTVICRGPGSFTGLRLGYSALKAFEAANKTPIYGISTLKAYAFPYFRINTPIITCLDAKKDRFYASIYKYGEEIFPEGDYTPEEIFNQIRDEKAIAICGPDGLQLKNLLVPMSSGTLFISEEVHTVTTETLFILAEEKISKDEPPLKDFDGPVYLRASEAEVKLNESK